MDGTGAYARTSSAIGTSSKLTEDSTSALSDSQVVRMVYSMFTRQSRGRGWVRHMFRRRSGVLCILSLIYILWFLQSTVITITLYFLLKISGISMHLYFMTVHGMLNVS